jgi:hypothetical protein
MHDPTRTFVLLFVIFILAVSTNPTGLHGQSQGSLRRMEQQNTDMQVPVVDYVRPEPDDPEKRALLKVRGSRHTRGDKQLIKELPLGIEELPLTTHWWWGVPAIPVDNSDVIVIGQIIDAQANLSNDKTAVYSEFIVSNEEVLKNNTSTALSNTITVERFGGAVRFQSGRVQHYRRDKQGLPQVGHRYLFFLRRNEDSQDFSILTGYELSAGRVFALDSAGSNAKSKLPFDDYNGFEERVFFNKVQNAVANSLVSPEKGRQN